MSSWMVILFLYFPEDKAEYIPATISFIIFAIACVLTFRWIVKKSKRQEEQVKELEERILRERQLEKEKNEM